MTLASRIPPLLAPYLSLPPPTSLILLTSVLGASTNWLLFRFLNVALSSNAQNQTQSESSVEGKVKIVLVSFLRDWEFWRDGGSRMGTDFLRLGQKGELQFVDGMSGLFGQQDKPRKGNEVIATGSRVVLKNAGTGPIEEDILKAIEKINDEPKGRSRVLLMVDGLDLLLAATEASAIAVGDMLLNLREHVHSTIITASADSPLVQSQNTPLEINHAAFVACLAHQAYLIMSLRILDTGTARDVSGVLRVTRGTDKGERGQEVEEMEVLYFVGGDGSVKVFERGA